MEFYLKLDQVYTIINRLDTYHTPLFFIFFPVSHHIQMEKLKLWGTASVREEM